MPVLPYQDHLRSADDLVTSYEATRAGFVALALEKNRRATPHVAAARALQEAASRAKTPGDLLTIQGIEAGLLTAAGLSDKALAHLPPEDRRDAISRLIREYLEPAGERFVEELVFRYLLTCGDALGGSMRNVGGVLGQRRLTRAVFSTLTIAGIPSRCRHSRSTQWNEATDDEPDVGLSLRGIAWHRDGQPRTLLYGLRVPLVGSHVDVCLLSVPPDEAEASVRQQPHSFLALGELKGGIDPAGADEHWKTAQASLNRIRAAFSAASLFPKLFFVGAAVERRMAGEIWRLLENGLLSNAANLNDDRQVASLSRWLCSL